MALKYGIDYGIKVNVPWYIKCPIINRLFDTCLVKVSLDTFSANSFHLSGVVGRFRIPIVKTSLEIRSCVRLSFALPEKECVMHYGKGLYCTITLLDVNHKNVLSTTEHIHLSTSFYALPKEERVWFGEWKDLCIDLKFGNWDFYEI